MNGVKSLALCLLNEMGPTFVDFNTTAVFMGQM